jgi:hypothetical protein
MLNGTLDDFRLPDVLRLISLARKTGVLRLSSEGERGSVYFRTGRVYFAEVSTDQVSVGQRLVDAGLLAGDVLDAALARSDESGRPVAEILRTSAGVPQGGLERAVRDQIQDATFELMRWGEGEFAWQNEQQVQLEVSASLAVDDLILEAARRLDDLAVRERKVVSERSIPTLSAAFASAADPITISPEQWRILALLDGRRSARQIALLAGMDVEEALRDLYRLVTGGVVEVADPVEAAADRPSVFEPAPVAPSSPAAPDSAPPATPAPPPVESPTPQMPERAPVSERPPEDAPPSAPRRPPPPPGTVPSPPAPPQAKEDFAAFIAVAKASAQTLPAPASPVEAFDAPGPELRTEVPGSAPKTAADGSPQADLPVAGTTQRTDEEVDPELIARLIRGVKEL